MEHDVSIDLFTFADGSTHETIVFGEAARAQRRATSGPVVEVCCRSCGSDLVYPLAWESTSKETWMLRLRCPDCEAAYDVALGRYTMERFVTQLHSQKRALTHDLARWELACFREETERLMLLIAEDRVLPVDF
jgi:ribosomal protein S27E